MALRSTHSPAVAARLSHGLPTVLAAVIVAMQAGAAHAQCTRNGLTAAPGFSPQGSSINYIIQSLVEPGDACDCNCGYTDANGNPATGGCTAAPACNSSADAVLALVPGMFQAAVQAVEPAYAALGFLPPYVNSLPNFNMLIYDIPTGGGQARAACIRYDGPGYCNDTAFMCDVVDGAGNPNPDGANDVDDEILEVASHELFHSTQRAYLCGISQSKCDDDSEFIGGNFGAWVAEGQADLMMDKVFTCTDTFNDVVNNDFGGFWGEVNCTGTGCQNAQRGPLDFPATSLLDRSYGACLFWNYCCEQYQSLNLPEPGFGSDFMLNYWQNLQDDGETGEMSAISTLDDLIASSGGVSLDDAFLDYSITNYTHTLNVTGLSNPQQYSYSDEGQGGQPPFDPVPTVVLPMPPPGVDAVLVPGSVDVYGTQYFDANVNPTSQCLALGFQGASLPKCGDPILRLFLGEVNCCNLFPEVCTPEVLGWGLVPQSFFGTALGLNKRQGREYAQTFLSGGTTIITRLGAIVAGLRDPSQFNVRYGSGFPTIEITDPTTAAPICPGNSAAPRSFVVAVRVDGPESLKPPSVEDLSVQGLTAADFTAQLSGPASVAATVTAVTYLGPVYLLTVSADVPVDGLYDLAVGLCNGLVSDISADSVFFFDCTVNLMVVLDRSGSMEDPAGPGCTKLDAAKEAAGAYVDIVPSTGRVGVIAFWGDGANCNNDGAQVNTSTFALGAATNAQRTNAVAFIEALDADGRTSVGDGLKRGQDQFAPFPGPTQLHEILLLSDGKENEARFWEAAAVCAPVATLIPDKTTIRTISFGPEADEEYVEDIAVETGGNYVGHVPECAALAAGSVAGSGSPDVPTTMVNQLTNVFIDGVQASTGKERLYYEIGTATGGVAKNILIPVTEGGVEQAVFFFNVDDRATNPQVSLFDPGGNPVVPPAASVYDRNAHVVFHLAGLGPPGTWRAELRVDSDAEYIAGLLGRRVAIVPLTSLGLAVTQNDPGRACTNPIQANEGQFKQGIPVTILATLTDNLGGVRDATVEVTIIKPDGTRTCPMLMRDDATQNDGQADDGVYGLIYTDTWQSSGTGADNDPGAPPPQPGAVGDAYRVVVHAAGDNNYSETFQRWMHTAFHVRSFLCDSDGDGLSDSWERYYGTDPLVPDAGIDEDADGLLNRDEFKLGTHPFDPDTDGDGELDASEAAHGRSPTCPTDSPLVHPTDVEAMAFDEEDHEGRNATLRPGTIALRFPWYPGYDRVEIFRAADAPAAFALLDSVGSTSPPTVNYFDAAVDPGRRYFYRFQGVGPDGGRTRFSRVVTGIPTVGGACCLPAGGCSYLTWEQCDTAQGTYHGDGTACAANDACDSSTMVTLNDGLNDHDNRCTTDDGPATDGCMAGAPPGNLRDELWYRYTATCTGDLTISMCAGDGGGAFADYDAYIVVYGDGSPNCSCPLDATTELSCSDNGCGVVAGPAKVTIPVSAGDCFTVGVGGWANGTGTGDSQGTGVIFVDCEPGVAPPPPLLPLSGGITRNRFVGFLAAPPFATAAEGEVAVGAPTAIRMTLRQLPPPHDIWNGARLWVGDPFPVCELAGVGPGQTCPTGVPRTDFAQLDCVPHCRTDWSTFGPINALHEGVVPGAIYRLQAIYCGDDLNDERRYSAPLDLGTSRWGDCCGPFGGGAWSAPDGRVDVTTDVVAALEKFGNRGGAPEKARVDVEPARLDLKINITDVTRILDAFRNQPYPFGPGTGGPPCPLGSGATSRSE